MTYDLEHPDVAASQARHDGNVDFLLDLLNDTELRARRAAAYNLGKLKSTRAVPALARCLLAADETLRLLSLGALASIGDDSISQDVFEVASSDPSLRVRAAAVSTLVALGDGRAGALVVSMFDDPDTRRAGRFGKWSLEMLIASRDVAAIPALEERARKSGFRERRRIRRAIETLRTMEPNRVARSEVIE